MTATFATPVRERHHAPFSILRFLRGGSRIRKIRPGDLSDEMRRDLGFADGHIVPPRNLLRD
jgi:hypothetical protein